MELRFRRDLFSILRKRMGEPRRFLQFLAGPRQVGKTTLARQLAEELAIPSHYATADEPTLQDRAWVNQQWDIARALVRDRKGTRIALLIIDEVQKIPGWSETVKRLWDEDTATMPLRLVDNKRLTPPRYGWRSARAPLSAHT
jgi:predicted AAA+ superfamily ATPase